MEISKEDKERIENKGKILYSSYTEQCAGGNYHAWVAGAEYEHAHLSQQLKQTEKELAIITADRDALRHEIVRIIANHDNIKEQILNLLTEQK